MGTVLSVLALALSLMGMLFPPLQALFPRLSLETYVHQRGFRRAAGIGGLFLAFSAFADPAVPIGLAWTCAILSSLALIASEVVLRTDKLIPPLDDPVSLPAADASLDGGALVLGAVISGSVRAWPLALLTPHHIVNDEVAGIPVAPMYCPACRSGFLYDRRIDGRVLSFEPVTVRRRNMVMRDRETGTVWQHETGKALAGPLAGRSLTILDAEYCAWGAWKREHPSTTIAARRADYRHPSPLGAVFGHLLDEGPRHLVGPGLRPMDSRLDPHSFVIGIQVGHESAAWELEALKRKVLVKASVGSRVILLVYEDPADRVRAFALPSTCEARDFELVDGRISLMGGGALWDGGGHVVSGPVDRLEPLPVAREWWLAWSEYHPGTTLTTS